MPKGKPGVRGRPTGRANRQSEREREREKEREAETQREKCQQDGTGRGTAVSVSPLLLSLSRRHEAPPRSGRCTFDCASEKKKNAGQ